MRVRTQGDVVCGWISGDHAITLLIGVVFGLGPLKRQTGIQLATVALNVNGKQRLALDNKVAVL